LFLGDRGYFKLSYLESIDTAGGFYVVRAKTTVNPIVVAAFNRQGKVLKRFSQKKQKDVKKHIRRSIIVDMDVEGKTQDVISTLKKNMAKNHQFFVKIYSKSEPDKR
jgi:outer membrane protein assembly factor BamD (BamD/ComL family)